MCFNYQDTEWRHIALVVSNISFNFLRHSSGINFCVWLHRLLGALVGAPTAEHARH